MKIIITNFDTSKKAAQALTLAANAHAVISDEQIKKGIYEADDKAVAVAKNKIIERYIPVLVEGVEIRFVPKTASVGPINYEDTVSYHNLKI